MENPREERGLMIAATMNLRRKGDLWIVPSQTRSGATYTVNFRGDVPKCSCPDFDRRQQKCKHIFAAEFGIRRETGPDGTTTITKTVRVTYGQDWAAYNAAQTSEKAHVATLLRELCGGIQQPPPGPWSPAAAAFRCNVCCSNEGIYDILGAARY